MGDRMGYQPNRAGMVSENGVGILIQTDAKDMGFGYGFDFDQRRYSPIPQVGEIDDSGMAGLTIDCIGQSVGYVGYGRFCNQHCRDGYGIRNPLFWHAFGGTHDGNFCCVMCPQSTTQLGGSQNLSCQHPRPWVMLQRKQGHPIRERRHVPQNHPSRRRIRGRRFHPFRLCFVIVSSPCQR